MKTSIERLIIVKLDLDDIIEERHLLFILFLFGLILIGFLLSMLGFNHILLLIIFIV